MTQKKALAALQRKASKGKVSFDTWVLLPAGRNVLIALAKAGVPNLYFDLHDTIKLKNRKRYQQ